MPAIHHHHATRQDGDDNDLGWPDYLVAVLGHLLLVTLLLVAARTVPSPPSPSHPISVQLVSPRQLAPEKPRHHRLQRQTQHPKKAKHLHKAKPKPRKVRKHAIKKPAKHAKTRIKPKHKKKKKAAKKPLDFDPFAKLEVFEVTRFDGTAEREQALDLPRENKAYCNQQAACRITVPPAYEAAGGDQEENLREILLPDFRH